MMLEKHGSQQFFSEEQKRNFSMQLLSPLKEKLQQFFSSPLLFLESGALLYLADYDPKPILSTVADELKIKLNLTHVPHRYYVTLKLDQEQTQAQGTLVFSLKELSESVEISSQSFTIQDLEKSWYKEE